MWTCNEKMTRRSVLQLGLSAAALLSVPPLRWVANADPTNPHFLVMLFGDGGWDPTQTIDVHDPLDATDGIDVDVPQVISGLPPSQIATAGGITYMSNPTTRPGVDAFFQTWGRTRVWAKPRAPRMPSQMPMPRPTWNMLRQHNTR